MPALNDSISVTTELGVEQRSALEGLLFFNANQHRVRLGIQQSIETYGVPEIYEEHGHLRIRVGDIPDVQSLFAVSDQGRPLGVAVFVRFAPERFVVLHLGVEPRRLAAMREPCGGRPQCFGDAAHSTCWASSSA